MESQLIGATNRSVDELGSRHVRDVGTIETVGYRVEPLFCRQGFTGLDNGHGDAERVPSLIVASHPRGPHMLEIIADKRLRVAGCGIGSALAGPNARSDEVESK